MVKYVIPKDKEQDHEFWMVEEFAIEINKRHPNFSKSDFKANKHRMVDILQELEIDNFEYFFRSLDWGLRLMYGDQYKK